jgi:hypothetical protein
VTWYVKRADTRWFVCNLEGPGSCDYLVRGDGDEIVASHKSAKSGLWDSESEALDTIESYEGRNLPKKEELNMTSVTQKNWAYYIAGQIGFAAYVESTPGMAKTACIKHIARVSGRWYLEILLSQWLPEDLGGIPFQVTKSVGDLAEMYGVDPSILNGRAGDIVDVMVKKPDARLLLAQFIPTVCLMDEFGGVAPSTQQAALPYIENGLGPDCWMYCAGNPIEAAASGVALTPPMVNRIWMGEWEAEGKAHSAGLRNNDEYPDPSFPIVPSNWMDYYDQWGTLTDSFLGDYPSLRGSEAYPTHGDAQGDPSKPYPSFRSWSKSVKMAAACTAVGASRLTQKKGRAGLVGDNAAVQFESWIASHGIPDAEEILAGMGYELPTRMDLMFTTTSSVVGALRSNCTPERWEAALDFVEKVYADRSKEVAMSSRGVFWKLKPQGHEPKVRKGAWREMDVVVREMVNES